MNRRDRRAEVVKKRALGNDTRLEGMDLRYGGRTLVVTVYLNTDGDPYEIGERVKAAARGPKLDMAVYTVGEVEAETAAPMWSAVFSATENYVKKEGKA